MRASRLRAAGPPVAAAAAAAPVAAGDGEVSLLVAATIDELARVGRLGTVLGQQAVRLAERMGGQSETGAAVASLSKELRATMAAAVADARPESHVDELRARRASRRG